MADKAVWDLSEQDFKEIEDLYEKKLALENLAKIIKGDNPELYDRLIVDYGKVARLFSQWWVDKSQKYNWPGESWWVDFDTRQVMMKSE